MSETNDVTRSTRSVARAVLSAFQAHDLDAFRECLAPDAHFTGPSGDVIADDPDEIIAVVRPTITAFPDLEVEVMSLTVEGDRAVADVMRRGTQTGPLRTVDGEIPPTGNRVRMPEAIILEVEGGRVVHMKTHVDRLYIMTQLDVLKP